MNHAEPRPPVTSKSSPRAAQNPGSNAASSALPARLPRLAGSASMAPSAVAMRWPPYIVILASASLKLMTGQPPRFDTPPQSVCVLRLSAIGDTCHAAAALRALNEAWPQTRFTWIIGKLEAKLMSAILPDVEFITFDKRAMTRELLRLRKALESRRFDLLLDMQLSIRASLVSTLISAPFKLGFDRARARELQWLFTNAQIAPAASEHVLDSFLGFVRACGIQPGAASWNITLPAGARDYAARLIPASRPTLVISPCSSHRARNWSAERYAAVADHAARIHGMRVILAGGRSAQEQ